MTLLTPDQTKVFDDFLTKTLKTSSYRVFQLAGDASTRKYYRVAHEGESWVLMYWEPFEDNDDYPFLSVLGHFQKHTVHVPTVIAKAPREGLVLLEDLGDLTLERKFWENQNQELILPFYKLAIDELIKIHYTSTQDKSNCTAFKIMFDEEKFTWELNYAVKNLLEGVCQIHLKPDERSLLTNDFKKISQTLHNEKKYISHRDYHSRNLMIKLGDMRVIDFQDARLGPIQYDLVSLLRDSYVDLDSDLADNLIQYYLSEREKHETPIKNMDHFWYIYEVQSVQRCFKACGTFAAMYVTRNDTRYLKYLNPTLLRVKSSLMKLGEYKHLHGILVDHGVLEKDYLKL